MNILQRFDQQAAAHPGKTAFQVFGVEDSACTWQTWHDQASAFAAALVDQGMQAGEVVAILASNTAAWPIADIGALMAGCITVGVYPTSAPAQVHEILDDCTARVVVVDGPEQRAKVEEIRSGLPNLRMVLCEQDGSFDRFIDNGRAARQRHHAEIRARSAATKLDDVALLIYTSGSTGMPKGARISHRCIAASAESIASALGLRESDTSLSFLPYCHAGERIFGHYTRILLGMRALLVPNSADIWQAAVDFQPTVFGGLPRFYEKIHEAVLAGHATIESMIGARVRIATSGGATLSRDVAEALARRGLVVLGAYGLTEHLCAAMQRPASCSFDSVGLPMPGTELRIAATGEIQIRKSDLTFSGYQNKPAETRAAFTEDGEWLRTGDLGFIDENGRLHVTGREKELIALAGGKKVAPVPIERRLTQSPYISQAVLFGENRKYIGALIVPHKNHARQPGIAQLIQAAVDEVNATLSRPEQIKKFVLLQDELTVEKEELTPTLKVRRAFVEQKYQMQLQALYTST